MKVLSIGTSGFVGSHFLESLRDEFEIIESPLRLARATDWRSTLAGCDAVILAAGVPQSRDQGEQYSKALRELNCDGINKLVDDIRDSPVRVLVNVSSVAASGFMTSPHSVSEEVCEDRDEFPYGKFKRMGEEAVLRMGDFDRVGLSFRTPLIYGGRAKGNWPKLVQLSRIPAPLPFRSVQNRRSFLGIHNLVDFLSFLLKLDSVDIMSGVYNISDGEPVSFSDVISALRESRGRGSLLFPFPPAFLMAPVQGVMGTKAAAGIFSDLVLDTSKLENTFSWRPRLGTIESLRAGYGE